MYFAREDERLNGFKAFLEKNGIKQAQYCSDNLANVYDIADDLVNEYADLVCFVASKQTYEFIEGIIKLLKKQKKILDSLVITEDEKLCRLMEGSVGPNDAAEELGKRLGCQIVYDLKKQMKENNEKNKNENSDLSLRNGVIAYFSGQYIAGDKGHVKHIEINAEELNEEVLSALADKNAGNSALYTFSETFSQEFNEIKKIARKTDFLLTNHIGFEKKSNNAFELKINGETSRYIIKKSKYSEYVEENEETFVEITDEKDLHLFLEDIKTYELTGKINHERSWKPILMNACRWGDRAECTLRDLPRMKISKGDVYPCYDSDRSIGDISHAYFELKKRSYLTLDEEERKRACGECPAKNKCGRCAMLPRFISEEMYCEIMKSEYSPVVFHRKMLGVKFLLSNRVVPQLSGVDYKELRFLTKGSITDVVESGDNEYLNDYSLFFSAPQIEKWFMFCLASRKIYTISKDFYDICGLFVGGLSRKKMLTFIMKKATLEEKEANDIINEVFKTLNNGGFIKSSEDFGGVCFQTLV
ncbi:MAG: hypothetical protein K6B15_03545 [Parasporobacterium sp.]|nr:hypothetical protein [Parasporobacterium sp.]